MSWPHVQAPFERGQSRNNLRSLHLGLGGQPCAGYAARVKLFHHFYFVPLVCAVLQTRGAEEMLPGAKRVLFLGDSITYSGQYVEIIEAYFATRFPDRPIEFLNLGLPSET